MRDQRVWMINKIRTVYPDWMALYSFNYGRVRKIYCNMRDHGYFKKLNGRRKKEDSYEQMTIFDFISVEKENTK